MAKFSFSNTSTVSKPVQENKEIKSVKKEKTVKLLGPQKISKIDLIHHEAVDYTPEYYTYINSNGESVKYSGLVVTDLDGSYIGKTITTHKVILKYHPAVKPVEAVDEYFSYEDNYGRERIFTGEPKFDLEKNTYYGEVVEDILHDKIVTIYKEK